MGPPAGPVRVSLSLGGGHDENERRSEASDGGPGAEVHSSAARGGLDRPGRFWPGARQCGRHDHPLRAVTAARSPAPATSDRERCHWHGRCRRRPRTSAQPTPRDLQRTARAACLKHACLTAMAAWLPAFSGYRRGRPPAASTLARPRAGRACAATSDHAAGSTRNTSRTRELTLADSVWVGARISAAKSVRREQRSTKPQRARVPGGAVHWLQRPVVQHATRDVSAGDSAAAQPPAHTRTRTH
jgi:hypothetical protein